MDRCLGRESGRECVVDGCFGRLFGGPVRWREDHLKGCVVTLGNFRILSDELGLLRGHPDFPWFF